MNETLSLAHAGVAAFLSGDPATAETLFAESIARSLRKNVHARDLFTHVARLAALAARGEARPFAEAHRGYQLNPKADWLAILPDLATP